MDTKGIYISRDDFKKAVNEVMQDIAKKSSEKGNGLGGAIATMMSTLAMTMLEVRLYDEDRYKKEFQKNEYIHGICDWHIDRSFFGSYRYVFTY